MDVNSVEVEFNDNQNLKFESFLGNICNIYNLDKKSLLEIWNKIKINKVNSCLYIYQKGNKSGCMCSKKVFGNSEFCETHHNQIMKKLNKNKSDTNKSDTNNSVNVDSNTTSNTTSNTNLKSPILKSKCKLDIKLNNKIGKYWNSRFRFIFNNKNGEHVIGVYREQTVQELNINDLEICKRYNLTVNHDKDLIKNKYDSDDCNEGSLECSDSDSE